jgi:hypothetical protein
MAKRKLSQMAKKKKDKPLMETVAEEIIRRVKEENRTLSYVFTDEEQIGNGKRMCELVAKVTRLEDEKKAVGQEYGNKITLAKTELYEASTKVGNGYEFRNIKCICKLNTPEIGTKTVFRTDYEETDPRAYIGEEKMTAAEMQEELDFEESNNADNIIDIGGDEVEDERED